MDVGKRIRQRRIEIGMTVDELANKIGKNRATIYRYENGDIENLPLPVLEPIAKALGIEPSDLLSTTDTMSTEEKIVANLRKFNLSQEKEIIENIQTKLVLLNKDSLNKTDDYISDLIEDKSEQKEPELTAKDEKDIAKRLEAALEDLENQQEALMFSGEPLDAHTRELLKASLENSIRIAKINAKEKYTPKKYKKD